MTLLPIANGRSVEEWRGKTPDETPPPRVRLRVFDRGHDACHKCGRVIRAGDKWTLEHLTALINWLATKERPHGNVESNLGITCSWCLPEKNAEDVAEKSRVYEKRVKHLLPKQPSRLSSSRYRKTMSGAVVDRVTGEIVSRR